MAREVLALAGVLLIGAAAGFWLSEQRSAALYRAAEAELAELNREVEADASREYFEQMGRLLVEEGLLESEEDSEVQRLARARTLAAVSTSGAEDNRRMTRFLTDMDLATTSDPVKILRASYLPNAQLAGAYLPAADLYVSTLRGADLSGAFLISANLGGAGLGDADLGGAVLRYAALDHADLRGADLRDADLTRASMAGADLRGANLEGAKVTDEQLDACESLDGARMPDGSLRTPEG